MKTDAFTLVEDTPKPYNLMSPADYYQAQEDINDIINNLYSYRTQLSPKHMDMLRVLCAKDDSSDFLTVDEVTKQFQMVKKLRNTLLDHDNNIMINADAKGLSALISSINSLISLFIRSQDKINHMKEVADLREAVLTAVSTLPQEARQIFLDKLDSLSTGS